MQPNIYTGVDLTRQDKTHLVLLFIFLHQDTLVTHIPTFQSAT